LKSPAVAIILARGGSKGVARKNMALVAGRPCLLWTIEHARQSTRLTHVALSSDDEEMLGLARREEIVALRRSSALASDSARVDDAAREAFTQLVSSLRFAATPSLPIVILYGNVPVRPVGLIDRALSLLEETGADSVQSYQPVGKHHPWWTARVDPAGGRVSPWEGDVLNHGIFRRQDLPAAHVPDGAVLVVTKRALFREIAGVPDGPHAFFGRDRRGIINPEGSVVDIDTKYDLLVADAVLRENAAPSLAANSRA
jgi:CMP-N-acetylneuraminic acid synthetase